MPNVNIFRDPETKTAAKTYEQSYGHLSNGLGPFGPTKSGEG